MIKSQEYRQYCSKKLKIFSATEIFYQAKVRADQMTLFVHFEGTVVGKVVFAPNGFIVPIFGILHLKVLFFILKKNSSFSDRFFFKFSIISISSWRDSLFKYLSCISLIHYLYFSSQLLSLLELIYQCLLLSHVFTIKSTLDFTIEAFKVVGNNAVFFICGGIAFISLKRYAMIQQNESFFVEVKTPMRFEHLIHIFRLLSLTSCQFK
ncbi:hypothetical protein BpHYR1_051676 [Brachionus plicatilis]|uniref:Uncharacterized protein n=1 Tax=Brachionus plicatilis TaxID=10195 RepID=A0A3M7Q6A3_BRAPC|nr:hypothetical protein BpHYR1_051676 [Brachionus plicatilis]